MKRIFKFIILLVICFLPVMVDAKVKLNYEWNVNNKDFIVSDNGNYYFSSDEYMKLDVYDKDGTIINRFDIEFQDNTSISEIYNNKLLKAVSNRFDADIKYNSRFDKYYSVRYGYESDLVIYGNVVSDSFNVLSFSENLENVKAFLGVEYEIYEQVTSMGIEVWDIVIEEDLFLVYGYNSTSDKFFAFVYDEDGKLLLEENGMYNSMFRVFGNKIYLISESAKVEIFDLECELLETFDIYNELDKLCRDCEFNLENFRVDSNNLIVQYSYRLPKSSNIVNDTARAQRADFFVAKFKLEYDLELESSKNGSFSAEKKIDELDREYVELKITPNKGFEVEKIIVTDLEGNQIEVIDNKFYMPNSDVNIEVQFRSIGEYVPIPDTFLGRNLTIIFIGLILIGLGVYTVNYVKN